MKVTGITCRGSYALGSACGNCTRCTEDFLDLSQKGWIQDGPHKMVPPGTVPSCAVPNSPPPIEYEIGQWYDLQGGYRVLVYKVRENGCAEVSVVDEDGVFVGLGMHAPNGAPAADPTPNATVTQHPSYWIVRKPPPPAVKTCKDCRHCVTRNFRDDWKCGRPTDETDLVTGQVEPLMARCIDERRGENAFGTEPCGKDGKFWEPKS